MARVRLCSPGLALGALLVSSLIPLQAPRASTEVVNGTWSALSAPAPSPRREYAVGYDELGKQMILFGGFGFGAPSPSGLFNEVWTLSLGDTMRWRPLSISGPRPGERHSPQYGFDAARRRMLIFGGYGHHYPGGVNEYLADVWELTIDSDTSGHWTELFPSGTAPAGRLAGAAVYDPLRQRFIGFGGTAGLPVDTWMLDLSGAPAWSTVDTDSTGPRGGYGMASIYDPVRDRMLVFGGSTSDSYFGVHNETWELKLADPPTWKRLHPAGTQPYARRTMAAIYDPLRDRMVIFGGWDATPVPEAFLNETWALDLAGEGTWGQLSPSGPIPIRRDAHAAVYDPSHDRLVTYGGWEASYMLGDTPLLNWGDQGDSTSFGKSSQAAPGLVQLQWSLQRATGPYTAVYRRRPGTPWSSVSVRTANASGAVQFSDTNVQPGQQYGYKLVASSERGPTFGGELWVTVPSTTDVPVGGATALAFRGVAPNPVADHFTVSFTLPASDVARIELVDISGRRILDRDLGSLGAGPHQVEFTDLAGRKPGVYFLRLRQLDRTVSRRIVLE